MNKEGSAMSSGPMSRADTAGPGRPRSWIREGLIASGRGAALTGLILAEAGMLCALAVVVTFAGLGVGLFLIPGTLLAIRRLANLTRQLAGRWCGVDIAVPYLPQPVTGGGDPFWPRFGRLLTDQATWRDLLWMTVDCSAGWVLTLIPAALVVFGLFGVAAPAEWHSSSWYAMIHLTSTFNAWLCVPLGLAFTALGLWAAPRLLRPYGRLAHSMLAPTRQAELALRVAPLAKTRSELVDTRPAEVRRVERDLHDSVRARLVAMGMTLSAAEQVLDGNPAAARTLLREASDSSATALAELCDPVRVEELGQPPG